MTFVEVALIFILIALSGLYIDMRIKNKTINRIIVINKNRDKKISELEKWNNKLKKKAIYRKKNNPVKKNGRNPVVK